MATIKYVKTPDGVTHNIGGGGGTPVTYSISLGAVSSNAVPIILTGSNGTTDTVYVKGGGDATMSVSGDTMTITASSGQTITYTLSGSGTTTTYTITATPSSGTPTSATIPAATTTGAGVMTADDKTKLGNIADYVIETGTSNSWRYRKWNGGDYECWRTLTPTVKSGTSYNGLYYATYTVNAAFPITFTAVPNVIASCRSGTMGFLGDITVTASQLTAYNMYRAGSGNVGSALSVYVIGRWK